MRILRNILAVGFVAGLIFLGVYAAGFLRASQQNQQLASQVAEFRQQQPTPAPTTLPTQTPTAVPTAPQTASPAAVASQTPVPSPTQSPTPRPTATPSPSPRPTTDALMAHYAALANENPHMIGWIHIENTPVDYPVMHTPDDPEYYLHRNFEQQYALEGIPFLDARCDPMLPSGNLIIYGHNMRSGSMFGTLYQYAEKEYFQQHPLISFDTLERRGTYRVFAAIPIVLMEMDHERMRCYALELTQDNGQLDGLRAYVEKYAIQYDLTALPDAGDEVITLSTCTGITNANRLVIMAARTE